MDKMKALIYYGPFDLRLEEIDIPKADDDSLVIRVRKGAICNATDYHILDGSSPALKDWLKVPHVFGHEHSGEVIEVGKNITDFKVKDRIAFGCKMGDMDGGAFAEYSRIYPHKLFSITKLADNLDYEDGALLEPLYGVLGGTYSAGIRPADKVLILGVGQIGLLYVQVARLALVLNVIAVDLYDNRLRKAEEGGADLTINVSREDMVEKVKKHCGEIDLIIDATGSEKAPINEGLNLLRVGGRYLMHGYALEKAGIDTAQIVAKGIQLSGIDPAGYRKMMPLANKLVSQGLINVKTLVTHRLKLSQVEEGVRMCRDNPEEVIKVIIDVS